MKTTFIPFDYDYFDFEGKNYTKVFGRNSEGKRICIIDSCPVYLWAILKDKIPQKKIDKLIKEISKIQLDIKGRKTKVEKVELHNKNFLSKPVKALKIFATNYKDLHDIADKLHFPEITKRRGYDLGFVTHYINEKKISPLKLYGIEGEMLNNSLEFGGIDMALDVDFCIKLKSAKEISQSKEQNFKYRALAYDIETDELKLGEGEILMISLVGNDGFQKVITWKKDESNLNNNFRINKSVSEANVGRAGGSATINSKNKQPTYIEYVENEAELIEKFIKEIKNQSPDFLIGYNSDGFDLPYIKARAEKFNIKLSLGLDDSQPKFSRGGIGNIVGKIKGIAHIDLLKFIRVAYAQYMKSETLSLNEVAKEFLGDEKKKFAFQHSSNIKGNEWIKYYEYNLHDSILTLGLFEKFWPDLLEFTRVIQEPTFDLSRAGLSKYTESYLIHNLEKFNEIPEKRPTHDEISQRRHSGGVEGAYVVQPTPGLYENIAMFDFTSMHTSIIITHNLSKSTLLNKKEKNSIESPELELGGEKQKFYFSKKLGFFPELLKDIFEKRKYFKAEYKKEPNQITLARSNAFKVLSASAHGYMGFFGARYYSIEASASVLAFVRKFNKETIEKIQKENYQVIYGDTDSIAFLMNKKTEKDIKKLLNKLNSELPGVMHLELDGFFKRGLWVTTRAGTFGAKKKYALIDNKNNIKIRGFETVRRDWCRLSRDLQNKVIRLILTEGNEKKALEYIKEIVKKIKNREVNLEDLIIRTQLKKSISDYKANTPHLVAAKRMEEQKIPISEGNLIQYFIAETPGKSKLVRDKVKLPFEKADYDIKYYLERQILPAVENILQVFGLDIKEIIEGKKQMTLAGF